MELGGGRGQRGVGRKTGTRSGSWRRARCKGRTRGHECHFTCALHTGKVTWLDLACHVGEIGKILVSATERWQNISVIWKDGKRAGAIRKDNK